jgi:hypothetical protein
VTATKDKGNFEQEVAEKIGVDSTFVLVLVVVLVLVLEIF